jgi:L-threonylcarbamoyladenylate synthase
MTIFKMPETMPDKIYPIDPTSPAPAVISMAADIITRGGVVVFPAQSLYGLAADALNGEAVDSIFEIKRRPPDKALLVLIETISDLDHLVQEVPMQARRIMEACWPGGVTLVFHARPDLPRNLTAGTGKIGVRLPLHPVARLLVKAARGPITGTSANLSGQAGCRDVSDIAPQVLEGARMTLDAGPLIGGRGSTVVDVTSKTPKILREGLVPAPQIFDTISGL